MLFWSVELEIFYTKNKFEWRKQNDTVIANSCRQTPMVKPQLVPPPWPGNRAVPHLTEITKAKTSPLKIPAPTPFSP